jgi:hypothetical protein
LKNTGTIFFVFTIVEGTQPGMVPGPIIFFFY